MDTQIRQTITSLHALMGEVTGSGLDGGRGAEFDSRARQLTSAPIQLGQSLIERAGGRAIAGTRAVQEKVWFSKKVIRKSCVQMTEMENLASSIASTQLAKSRQVREAFERDFRLVFGWLTEVAEPFLQQHRDMGRNQNEVQTFIQRYQQMQMDVLVVSLSSRIPSPLSRTSPT